MIKKMKEHIGLIIMSIFALFDGTLGIIEILILIAITYLITKIFKRKIAESVARINGYSSIASLVNNYLVKDERTNDLFSSLISVITDSAINRKQEEFNKQMRLWINITEVILFIITLTLFLILDI